MRRILLLSIALVSLVSLKAQVYDDCAAAEAAGPLVLPTPGGSGYSPPLEYNFTTSSTASGGDYLPSSMLPVPPSTANPDDTYFIFEIPTNGYYSFSITEDMSGTGPTTGFMSLGLAAVDCSDFAVSDNVEYNFFENFQSGNPVLLCTGMLMNAGEVYILGIATESGAGGDITITIQYSTSTFSINEECGSGEVTSDGMEHNNNCSADGRVWLEYTVVEGATVDLEVDQGSTPATSLSNPEFFQILEGSCTGNDLLVNGPTNQANLTCIPAGTVLYIDVGMEGVGATPPEQGDFSMSITDAASTVANDLCEDVTPINITTCETTNIAATNGTTENACPEGLDFGSCGELNTEPTVWFAFTTDNLAQTVSIELDEITQAGGSFVIIDGSGGACPVDISADMSACVTTIEDLVVSASTTYYIAVTSGTGGTTGTFNLNVTPNYVPVNNDCIDAIDISSGPEDATNFCATADPDGFCNIGTDDLHTVYFSYTVPGTAGSDPNVDLEISIMGNTNITGEDADEISLALLDACGGNPLPIQVIDDATGLPATDNMALCSSMTNSPIVVNCVEPGTVITIAAGSAEDEDGDFSIGITTINPAPSNDICDNADTSIGTLDPCSQVEDLSVDNTDACPETFQGGTGCAFDTEATVWYTVELPEGTVELEISDISDSGFIGLFSDCLGTQVGDCQSGTGGVIDLGGALTAITTYYIAASQIDAEGTFTFDLLPIVPPNNDDCDETDTNFTLASGVLMMGTTSCADFTQAFCTADNTFHDVFYNYTNTNDQNVDLTINISGAGTNPTTDISLGVFVDCAGDDYDTDPEFCNTLNTDVELLCVPAGQQLIFVLTSPDGAEGDFEITLTEDLSRIVSNDRCNGAIPLDAGINCIESMESLDNTDSCPEDTNLSATGCELDINNVLWYSITLPSGGIGIEFTDVDGGEQLALFENDCPDATSEPTAISSVDGNTCITDDESFEGLTDGGTYLLAVTLDGENEGAIEFTWTPIQEVTNDDCNVDNTDLDIVHGDVLSGSTGCADETLAFCGADGTFHDVFYNYTNTNDQNVDLTINVSGGGINPTTDISLGVFIDCTGADYSGGTIFCNTLGTDVALMCVPAGQQLVFAISSPDGSEGEFLISLTEDLSRITTNDRCNDPEALMTGVTCSPSEETLDNTDSCPEDTDMGVAGCDLTTDHVVWFSLELPADATGIEFSDLSAGVQLSLFENDCPGAVGEPTVIASEGGNTCMVTDEEFTGLIGGNTYLVAASLANEMEGAIEFTWTPTKEVVNDECVDAIDLTAGNDEIGTTACATQEDPITYDSQVCTDDDETNTVWYTYTVPDTDKGFNITITSTGVGFMGSANIVVFNTTNGDCDFTDVEGELCSTSGTQITDFSCVGAGTYTIRISTSLANQGEFTVNIEALTEEQPNDNCEDATPIVFTEDCVFEEVNFDNTGACPEDFALGTCMFDVDAVVWFSAELPAGGTGFEFDMPTAMYIGIFLDNCDPLTQVIGVDPMGSPVECVTEDIQVLGLTPGTYLFAIGLEGEVEGMETFEVKTILPPANDKPCDAEVVDNTGGDVDIVIPGNNDCATQEFEDPICGDEDISSVYYLYTVPNGVNGISITLDDIGLGTNFMLGAYDFNGDCNGAPTLLIDSDCDADGNEMILECLMEGDEIYIIVSTEADNAGDFNLTIDPTVPDPNCIDNDICENADNTQPISTPVTDDGFVCITDCNLNACPETFTAGNCDYSSLPTVFYTVTTDADAIDATMAINVTGIAPNPIDPIFTVFAACDDLTALPEAFCVESDGVTASQTGIEILPNTTYIIAVADANVDDDIIGGDFEICVNVITSCNDDPCTPYALDEAGTNVYTANQCDTNIGSTEDNTYDNPCGDPTITESSVYFTYTGGENISSVEIVITPDNSNGASISGDVSATVFNYDPTNPACAGDLTTQIIDQECSPIDAFSRVVIDCPVPNNLYLIQVATAAGDEGDFDITVTEVTQDPTCTANDICDNAIDLPIPETCEWLTFEGCNNQACPETFADVTGDCMFDNSPVVWYTFTTPDGTYSGDFNIVGSGADPLARPAAAIFQEDGCLPVPTPVVGAECFTQLAEVEDILLEANTTYMLIVGSSTSADGEFTINYKINAAPENDDPCINDLNPPIDITGGGHSGSTCCARGFEDFNPDGSQADWENVNPPCNNATSEASVWYMFTPTAGDQGYELVVNGGTIVNQMGVQIYSGTDETAGCTPFSGADLIGSSCSSLTASIKFGNCDPDLVYFIKVTTADDDCGTFDISIEPTECGDYADDCELASGAFELDPVTDPNFDVIDYVCLTSCLDFACPEESANGGCGEMEIMPTVWFQVNTDDIAAQLFSTVEANGNWTPIWSVYEGTSCDDMAVVNFGGAPPCSNGDDTPDLHQTGVSSEDAIMTWIAVTVDPASLANGTIDDGSFEICVATTINALVCLGDIESSGCDEESLTMEITGREFDLPLDPDGDGQIGPFCQGEEIDVSVSFFYDATESGADWLIGMVPTFGPGWDTDNFNFSSNAPTGNGNTGQYFPEGGSCAPILQENLPHMCTYVGPDGLLRLCNGLCQSCPCTLGMSEGDPLPGGYFWISNGGNAGCENDCSPGEAWGIGSTTANITWDFTIRTKIFDDFDDCFENKNLQISFQTFSDGVGGCWEDPVGECLIDELMVSPLWELDCRTPPTPIGNEPQICSGEEAGLEIMTEDGSTFEIVVEYVDNPNVQGEGTGTNGLNFPDGFGTVNDILINTSTSVQEVIYIAQVVSADFPCPSGSFEFIVTVYPELVVEFNPDFISVCPGQCIDISPEISGGTGNYTLYDWSTGDIGVTTINVCPGDFGEVQYTIIVEDDLGCVDEASITVQVESELEFDLGGDVTLCQDGVFEESEAYEVIPNITSDVSNATFVWNAEPGLEGFISGGNFIINEEDSEDFVGDGLELCAEGTSEFGCSGENCIIVYLQPKPEIILDTLEVQCNDLNYVINSISAAFPNGDPVENFIVRQCGGGFVIFSGYDAGGFIGGIDFIPFADFDCIEIIAFDDDSGCEQMITKYIEPVTGTEILIDDVEVCQGEQVTLSVINDSDFTDFSWSLAGDMTVLGTGSSYTFTGTETATYFVTASGAGCSDTKSASVTVNNAAILNLAEEFTFCPGGTATAEVSGGGTYLWTAEVDGSTVSTDATFTSGTEGRYYVAVTDTNGCVAIDTTDFIEQNTININILGNDICEGSDTELSFASDLIDVVWTDEQNATLATNVDSIIVNLAGTYTVTGEDQVTGCPAEGSITIAEFPQPLVDLPDLIRVCKDDSGVDSVFVDFASLVSGISGTWSPLQADPATFVDPYDNVSFLNIPSGDYLFVFTTDDAMAPCVNVSDTVTVNVRACPCPSLDLREPNPICNDGGTIDLNSTSVKITGESGTWAVIAGPPTQALDVIIVNDSIFTADGILAGDYTIEFTLSNPGGPNCESTNTTTITVVERPFAEKLMDGRICNIAGGSDPTTIDLNSLINATMGGEWTDANNMVVGDPTNIDGTTFSGPFPQTVSYTYTYTPAADDPCGPVFVIVDVLIRDCNCPFVSLDLEPICNTIGVLNMENFLTNDDNLTGMWSSVPPGLLIGSTFDPTGLNSGNYIFTYTLNTSPGPSCPLEYTDTMSVINQPVLTLTPQDQPCSAFTGNGETFVDLFDWIETNGTNGTWSQTSGSPDLNIDLSTPGSAIVDFDGQPISSIFEFVYTATSVSNPCVNPDITVEIEVADCNCPPIAIDTLGPFCNDAGILDLSTMVAGSDPGSFTVLLGTDEIMITDDMFVIEDADEGIYTIRYTLDQMVTGTCIQSVESPLEISNFRDIILDPVVYEVCNNSNNGNVSFVDFNQFPDNNFNLEPWVDIDGAGVDLTSPSNVNFNGVEAGSYRFSVMVNNNAPCPNAIDTLTITVDSCLCPLVQPLDPMPVCLTAGTVSHDLTQYDDVNQSGTWASVGGVLTISSSGELDLTGATAGNYELVYTIDDPSPDPLCDPTDTVTIVLLVPSEAGIGGSAMTCIDNPQVFDLYDLIDGEDTGGSWDPIAGLDAMAGTFDTDGLAPNVYTLTYRFLEAGECPADEANVTITINDLPIVNVGPGFELNCDITEGILSGLGSSTGADFTYLWNELDNGVVILDSTSMDITATQAGRYRLTVTNVITGCSDFAEVVVTESDDKPTMVVSSTDITCFGDDDGTYSLTGMTGGEEPYTFSFNGGPFVTQSELNLTGLVPGNYTIEIQDNVGCSTPYSFVINEPPPVMVDIAGSSIINGEIGQEFILTIEPFDTTGITSIVWSETSIGGNVVATDVTTINVMPPETTSYYVEVSNANGCTASDNVQLQLDINIDIVWPNIINPNGTDNPTFYIIDDDVETIKKMIIYDRWGNKVFDIENSPANDPIYGWDGKFNDTDVVPGVYVFYLEVLFIDGSEDSFAGDITVHK